MLIKEFLDHGLSKLAEKALRQIEAKNYDAEMVNNEVKHIIKFRILFPG